MEFSFTATLCDNTYHEFIVIILETNVSLNPVGHNLGA